MNAERMTPKTFDEWWKATKGWLSEGGSQEWKCRNAWKACEEVWMKAQMECCNGAKEMIADLRAKLVVAEAFVASIEEESRPLLGQAPVVVICPEKAATPLPYALRPENEEISEAGFERLMEIANNPDGPGHFKGTLKAIPEATPEPAKDAAFADWIATKPKYPAGTPNFTDGAAVTDHPANEFVFAAGAASRDAEVAPPMTADEAWGGWWKSEGVVVWKTRQPGQWMHISYLSGHASRDAEVERHKVSREYWKAEHAAANKVIEARDKTIEELRVKVDELEVTLDDEEAAHARDDPRIATITAERDAALAANVDLAIALEVEVASSACICRQLGRIATSDDDDTLCDHCRSQAALTRHRATRKFDR